MDQRLDLLNLVLEERLHLNFTDLDFEINKLNAHQNHTADEMGGAQKRVENS